MTARVRVTAVELVCALGTGVEEVQACLASGETGVVPCEVPGTPVPRVAPVPGPCRPELTRRRDRKLFSRPATLLLLAAQRALEGWQGDLETLGLFVGVRREPPDTGEADEAILASVENGRLSTRLLASAGRDLYPPLQPLRTLPNMALAHVAIQLGIRGESGVSAGGPAAGVMAAREGIAAVAEGRCPAALVGAADSWLEDGSLRDWARLGRSPPPGEAAVVFRIEAGDGPAPFGWMSRGKAGGGGTVVPAGHWEQLGHCGVADALVGAVLGTAGFRGVEATGAWAEALWQRE